METISPKTAFLKANSAYVGVRAHSTFFFSIPWAVKWGPLTPFLQWQVLRDMSLVRDAEPRKNLQSWSNWLFFLHHFHCLPGRKRHILSQNLISQGFPSWEWGSEGRCWGNSLCSGPFLLIQPAHGFLSPSCGKRMASVCLERLGGICV